MTSLRRMGSLGGLLALTLSVSACGPTYRKAQIVDAIQRIAQTEYNFQVAVKLTENTIAVHLHHAGILQLVGPQVGLAPSANEILSNLIEIVHRVVLSSDAPVNFYVVVVSDPAVPGAYLTIIRYLEDIRRANANIITPTELFSRTILDLKYLEGPGVGLAQLAPENITFEQFLSWQLAKRIEARLAQELQRQPATTVDVGPCVGGFQGGEFAFALNVTPKPGREVNEGVIQKIFEDATGVIAQVLSGYHFKDFEAIRLIHPPTGRSLLLPKSRLELFR